MIIHTQHYCAKYGSGQIRRNGSKNGQPKYQCTACHYQGLFVPAAVRKAAQYAQVDALLVKRNIARATDVARMTIAKRVKKAAAPSSTLLQLRPKKAQRKRWGALELDGVWTFVGRKKREVWVWLVVEQASRRIVGRDTGQPGRSPATALMGRVARRYRRHCWYFIDLWKAYAKGLPRWQHRPGPKGGGQTSIIEAINCSLRQRCGVLVRKSCSFSKSLAMHTARIKSVIDKYNLTLK